MNFSDQSNHFNSVSIEYTPDAQLKNLPKFLAETWRDLRASRELAWRLTVRDISARYRQSLLGVLWAFLPPIATTLVFVMLNRQQIINSGATELPYPAFVLIGSVLWQLFVDSLNMPLTIVAKNTAMLAKVNFPQEALVLSGLMQVAFDFGIKAIILVATFIAFGVPFTWTISLAIIPILGLVLLGTVIGLMLTPLGVLYSDVKSGLSILTSLWFFITPVAYNFTDNAPLSGLARYNPVTSLLVPARQWIAGQQVTEVVPLVLVLSATIFFTLIVWIVYRISLPILIERMSAG